jgi:hypothetical protein
MAMEQEEAIHQAERRHTMIRWADQLPLPRRALLRHRQEG